MNRFRKKQRRVKSYNAKWISFGGQFEPWNAVKKDQNLATYAEIVEFLLGL